MAAGIAHHTPAIFAHAGHVDEDVVRAEHTVLAHLVERRDHAEYREHVQRDWDVQLATHLPGLLPAGDIDFAAHDEADELVVGGEVLLDQTARVERILQLVAPAFEIAEGGAAA